MLVNSCGRLRMFQRMGSIVSCTCADRVLGARDLPEGIEVTFGSMEEGEAGSSASVAATGLQMYDRVLQALVLHADRELAAAASNVRYTDPEVAWVGLTED